MEAKIDVREARPQRGGHTQAEAVQSKPRKVPASPSLKEKFKDHRFLSCYICFKDRGANQFGISCNSCGYRFHGKCVSITPKTTELYDISKCPYCCGTAIPPECLEYEELYLGVRPPKKQPEQVQFCARCMRDDTDDAFLIACYRCPKWFHGKCVQITQAKNECITYPKCPSCSWACK